MIHFNSSFGQVEVIGTLNRCMGVKVPLQEKKTMRSNKLPSCFSSASGLSNHGGLKTQAPATLEIL